MAVPIAYIHGKTIARFSFLGDEEYLFIEGAKAAASRRVISDSTDLGREIYRGYVEPSIVWELDGYARADAGLTTAHPGAQLSQATLDTLNLIRPLHGFGVGTSPTTTSLTANGTGIYVYEDQDSDFEPGKMRKFTCRIRHLWPESGPNGRLFSTYSDTVQHPNFGGLYPSLDEDYNGDGRIDSELTIIPLGGGSWT